MTGAKPTTAKTSPEPSMGVSPASAPVATAIPLADALARLARGAPQDLSGLLHDVEVHAVIDGTKVVCHCHSIKLDGNGRPRVRDLVRSISDHVVDFAIPRSEITEAVRLQKETGSSARLVRLGTNARDLFTDLEQSGEGGELLLFVLAEKVLRLPQLICKMSLKTNHRMHVHGADGLHAGTDAATGKLVLYWGESKLYEDAGSAIRECLGSVAPMLAGDGNGSSQGDGDRDLQLLQRHADLDSPELESALKRFLDPSSADFNSLEFRGLCLVGFDCDAYPSEVGKLDLAAVVAEIGSRLPGWKKQIASRVSEEKLSAFGIHFMCVPFPSVEDFRKRLREELGLAGVGGSSSAKPTAAASGASPTSPAAARAKRKSGGRRNVAK